MKYLIKLNLLVLLLLSLSSCTKNPLEGTWQYAGGVYNGRQQKASPDFKMQRTYSANSYEAYKIEGASNQELYNSGVYEIHADTLSIISKFSSRPSQNIDITINYKFKINGDKLTINGILPNGMIVEEYWIKRD
jgi:hypothetical protein